MIQRILIKPYWKKSLNKNFKNHWQLYALLAFPIILVLVFNYIPMFGVVMAFENYNPIKGVFSSEWVGLLHFQRLINMPIFLNLLKNTLFISVYGLAAGFPIPVILALALFELRSVKLRKTIQMVTYAPFFISTVVMVGMIMQFLNPRYGIINMMLELLGSPAINFMGEQNMFRSIYVWSGIWQGAGFGAVLYLAALSGIDPQLYEAAVIDGANKAQRVWHVDLPGILPTLVIQLIMSMGSLLSVGYEKIYLMQNTLNIQCSEVISTYVYKVGLQDANYSFSTAVGLFNSVVNFIILAVVNSLARKFNETSLW